MHWYNIMTGEDYHKISEGDVQDYNWMRDTMDFQDPGGRSALRAGTRNWPCPECGHPYRLTARDIQLHYRCDECADRAEGIIPNAEY